MNSKETFRIVLAIRYNLWRSQPTVRFHSNLKILYFGTDKFSLPSLKLLSEQKFSRLEVVTSFKAKNNPIKQYAECNQLNVNDWPDVKINPQLCRQFDLGLVVSFGHMIPEGIINSFSLGMLNLHASLLPKYRGASPIVHAIKDGESETGVSIMEIRPKKFDVGDILATERVTITDHMLMPELHDKLAYIGAKLLVDCVTNINKYKPLKQEDAVATYAPKIDGDFCKIRWNEMSARDVFNLYRALYSFKHIQTTFNEEIVKLMEISYEPAGISDSETMMPVGYVTFCRKTKRLLVTCADRKCIEISKLTIGKKKIMSAMDFNNGFLKKCNENFRCFK